MSARETRGFSTLAEQLSDVREFSNNPHQRERTGLTSIDIISEGPAAGEIFTFLVRAFSGISMLATNIMANNAKLPLIFFSLEMPARQAISRLYATHEHIDHRAVFEQMSSGTLPDWFETLAEKIPQQVIVADDLTLGDMTAYIEQFEEYYGTRPSAVIIDYLELILADEGEGSWKTEYTAKALKRWSREVDVAVFLLHQTNRSEPVWEAPSQDSARSAGYTESDVVIGMWQPALDPKLEWTQQRAIEGQVHFNVLKNRITGRTTWQPLVYKLDDDLRLVALSEIAARRGR